MSTDEDPLAARFEALRERLLGTAWFVVGNRDDAREAVQEAFLRCWKARDPSRAVRDLDAWIFSVLLNVARDTRRRRAVRRSASLPTEDEMRPEVSHEPSRRAEAREDLTRVRAAIRELPDEQREVFLLRQNGDLPYERIASMLGIPENTAKTRMRRALLRLRAAIDPSAPTTGAAGA
ncbi:MAG: RNA polymerase sigma factor [Planctomycetes bacterium]|nr:RNA polymerase sigma factor [Planctomycetota bacterium]